jgi:hypothetical protein
MDDWDGTLRMALLGAVVGAGVGLIAAMMVRLFSGENLFPVLVPLMAATVALTMAAWSRLAMAGVSGVFGRIIVGGAMPSPGEFSVIDAHVVRGRFEVARALLEEACAAAPADAEPCLRLARLLRDSLARPEEAGRWLLEARRRGGAPEVELQATRELAELYLGPLARPAAALPELARLQERFPGSRIGEWAARRLAEERARLST